jgi:exosortase D (VPLPA-CTERM-specific)
MATLLALTVWLYGPVLLRLFGQWKNDPNFSHGFFVPLFAIFVLWQDRHRLAQIPLSPSWTGIPIIVLAMVMLAIGHYGVELFLTRCSFLLFLAGLTLLVGGRPLFRAVLFPWAFLILMIPIPQIIFLRITFPLQTLAAKSSAVILPIFQVPVLREGHIINLPQMPLEIAEACSGIRSLLSLITLAIIYGYLMDHRRWVRITLACSSIPIAVAANSFRIVGTGLIVQYWNKDLAEGFYHLFGGWLIFVVSLIMLFVVHRVIVAIWGKDPGPQAEPARAAVVPVHEVNTNGSLFRFLGAVVFMLATALLLQAHSQNEVFPPRENLSSFPRHFGSWNSEDIGLDQETLDILGHPEFLNRNYFDTQALQPYQQLFIAYYASQEAGDTIHSPSHCLPGAGWVPTARAVVQVPRGDGTSFPANRYVVSKGEDRQLVLYWFLAHDRPIASEYWAKYYLIADSIRMNRSDGSLIRLATPMLRDETPEQAEARVLQFVGNITPILTRYIPR